MSLGAQPPEQEHPSGTVSRDINIELDKPGVDDSVPGFGKKKSKKLRYVVGISLTSAPQYEGSAGQGLTLRPVLAFKLGRYRLSTSGGSAVMNFGEVQQGSGASADLIDTKKTRLKASLRISSGRRATASADLAGIPEVRKTILLRLSGSYELTDRWRAGTTFSYDILGRGTGLSLATGIGYVWPYSKYLVWNADANLVFGNQTNMNAYFGVPANSNADARSGYSPGAGVRGAGFSISFMSSLNNNIVLFGRLGYAVSLGQARNSPLTTRPNTTSLMIGIAYRCC